MTDTSFDGPLAVNTVPPSALTPMPQGRPPTPSMRRVTVLVATSMTATDSPRPVETYSVLPSGDSAAPIGRGPSSVLAFASILMLPVGTCLRASTTVTTPPFSQVTKAVAPSGVNTTPRGRGPVAIWPTTVSFFVSTANTRLSVSAVT